ncbi:hypothetical protein GCM10009716_00110 [Streptomyces sodiiphilus]|uniref:ABC transporter n=1 Tax=Streptomyces sodiiphilus TaxID=226217 RepID=A0ABP4ZZR2_9ACTN
MLTPPILPNTEPAEQTRRKLHWSFCRSHRLPLVTTLLTLSATLLLPRADDPLLFPDLAGGPPLPVPLAACVPLLMACFAVGATMDTMEGFSAHAARPRYLMAALAGAIGAATAAVLTTTALAAAGQPADIPLALRALTGFLGLACLGAAVVGVRACWTVPFLWALPVFLLGQDPPLPAWARWPVAENGDPTAWTTAALLAVTGTAAFLLRLSHRRR